ncbi:hypothetical protein [Sulfitobacter aestuariivivens]|uniref:Yip1 domain-containing protein n=1 Tax=Sulfitobacter aestuariivivens TaxID=2766981 RepID=A0A927D0S1_9RHOB|nr:hypothetical protein [Sulfitobacter aestuariivivens]MBD3662945.1 hypothetical protein [Sulfitobacter aestuariivivens]
MEQEITLETLSAIGPYLVIAAFLGSVIPSAVSKWLVSLIFGQQVSYFLILMISTITILISIFILFWLDLLAPLMAERDIPAGPSLLLGFASYLLQATMLTLFAHDTDGDAVALWKWLIVLVVQFILYILFSMALAFVLFAVAAA